MSDERLQVLKMVEEGKITAEDAVKLLSAVDDKGSEGIHKKVKYLMVRVEDLHSGRKKVNLKIPFFLVSFGMKFIPKEAKGVTQDDIDHIIRMAESGRTGEKLEIVDDEDSIKVLIWLE